MYQDLSAPCTTNLDATSTTQGEQTPLQTAVRPKNSFSSNTPQTLISTLLLFGKFSREIISIARSLPQFKLFGDMLPNIMPKV